MKSDDKPPICSQGLTGVEASVSQRFPDEMTAKESSLGLVG